MYKEEKELWVKFACAAIAGQTAIDCIHDVEDECETAAEYADRMVALYYDKFKDC